MFKLVNGEPKIEFAKVGRNHASTFTGLCAKHDAELFKEIDAKPLNVDNCVQRRQLAYRSAMREMHTELENSERAQALHEELCKGMKADPDETETKALHLRAALMKKAHELYRYRRKHFDKPAEDGKTPDLRHLIIEMENQKPVLAASSLFSTGFTPQGEMIGPMTGGPTISQNCSDGAFLNVN
jgi:hypothetical protein